MLHPIYTIIFVIKNLLYIYTTVTWLTRTYTTVSWSHHSKKHIKYVELVIAI